MIFKGNATYKITEDAAKESSFLQSCNEHINFFTGVVEDRLARAVD